MTRILPAAMLAASLAAAPAIAGEYTHFTHLPYTAPAAAEGPGCPAVALVNQPAGWRSGGTAVLLVTTPELRDAQRDSLIAALLHENAAVVEVAAGTPARCDGMAAPAAATPAGPLGELFAVLRAVTGEGGAGTVVAVGYGPGGATALQAARDGVAARHAGAGGPRFAAAAALGDGPPVFALGAPTPANEATPRNLLSFCLALAEVAAGLGEPGRIDATRSAAGCLEAMARAPAAPERPVAHR